MIDRFVEKKVASAALLLKLILAACFIAAASPASAGSTKRSLVQVPSRDATILQCGSANTEPIARSWDPKDREPRQCGPRAPRNYTPRFKGLGFDVLNYESEACFVPDQSFELLDTIVATVVQRVTAANLPNGRDKVLLISRTTSSVLTELGFALWPTLNLSDALALRRTANDQFRHLFDCDTGSMILLTVADALGVDAALVDSTIPGEDPNEFAWHNFVRWPLGQGSADWDMNFKDVCIAPAEGQLPYQGKALTQQQLWGYEAHLRALIWKGTGHFKETVADFRAAMQAFPERPASFNEFAWVVAANEFPERASLSDQALDAALRAVATRKDPEYEDTLACVYAFRGDFAKAIETEKAALMHPPRNDKEDFERRLGYFMSGRDCTHEP